MLKQLYSYKGRLLYTAKKWNFCGKPSWRCWTFSPVKERWKKPKGEGGAGTKRRRGVNLDINEFELVSLELARNTDMKQDDGTNGKNQSKDIHQRKMTLKFIFVTPRQLIEKEGKEVKEARVNLYTLIGGGGGGTQSYDLIGHKEDFRVNMQFALGTAMIGEELSHESELGQQSVSLCDESKRFIVLATSKRSEH